MITKICPISNKEFIITDDDLKFYEKMGVPTPTLCPEERQRRRIFFRNMTKLYRRRCDATDAAIISAYHEDQPFPVYENHYWWSDAWDAMDYGFEIDFSVDLMNQYKDLSNTVPRSATIHTNCENSDYSNAVVGCKNCYLVFGGTTSEDSMYGHIVWHSKNCFDTLYAHGSLWCSNSVDIHDCYDVHFSQDCAHCSESYFLENCRSCKHCFGSMNLRNKEYYFFNQKCTQEEYEKNISVFIPFTHDSIARAKSMLDTIRKDGFYPELVQVKSENISGNHIYGSKNTHYAFDVSGAEDCKFLYTVENHKDCYDASFCGGDLKQYCYECVTISNANNLIGCYFVHDSYDSFYSEFCYSCHDVFFCHGLRGKSYCVLNKQYSKEEYFDLKEKIIDKMKSDGQWGEFFPIFVSPFAYNETIANDYHPLTKEEALDRGYKWKEEKILKPVQNNNESYSIPDKIEDVSNDILEQTLVCEHTRKNYKIIKSELEFYRKMKLPIPRFCPGERHRRRMTCRNHRQLWDRKCAECGKSIQTTYAPSCSEKILCEQCYQATVN